MFGFLQHHSFTGILFRICHNQLHLNHALTSFAGNNSCMGNVLQYVYTIELLSTD